MTTTTTNDNKPAPRYLNRCTILRDVFPYEVVRVISNKTVEIRPMIATRIEDSNSESQEYVYASDVAATPIRVRLTKSRGVWALRGVRYFEADAPYRLQNVGGGR